MLTIICKVCKKEFKSQLHDRKVPKYCSRKCMSKDYATGDTYRTFTCQVCKKVFKRTLGQLGGKKTTKYCSYKCMGVAQRGRIPYNKSPRKDILCSCGCGQTINIRVNSINDIKRKFILGHNSTFGVWNKGLDSSDPRVQKYSGENNGCWEGGKSFINYPVEFSFRLRNKVRQRDNFTCQECGYTQDQLKRKLDVHHIDYDKLNNTLENLISLCRHCHIKTNWNRTDWQKYYQNKIK